MTNLIERHWRALLESEVRERLAKSDGTLTREQAIAAVMDERVDLQKSRAKSEEEVRRGRPRPPLEKQRAHPAVHILRAERERKGWTQEQVAKQMGTTEPAVSRFESSPQPTLDGIRRYAEAIELSPADLVRLGVL